MIRKMNLEDADRVYQIENESFFEPWSKKRLLKEFEENFFLKHFVYEKDGKVIGFYIISCISDLVEIFTIAIDKDYRGQGIGSELLEHLIQVAKDNGAKEIWLEASTRNEAAVNLYQKYGFNIQSTRKNYYQKTGEDAYNMIRTLL